MDSLEKELHGEAAERVGKVTLLKGKGTRGAGPAAAVKRAEALLKKEGADVPRVAQHRPGQPAAHVADAAASSKRAVGVKTLAHGSEAKVRAARHTSGGSFLNAFF